MHGQIGRYLDKLPTKQEREREREWGAVQNWEENYYYYINYRAVILQMRTRKERIRRSPNMSNRA